MMDAPKERQAKTLSPAASGRIHGVFHPTPTGSILVRKNSGKVVRMPATRQDRRRLKRQAVNDQKRGKA